MLDELNLLMLKYISELMPLKEEEIKSLRDETFSKIRKMDDPGLLIRAIDEIFKVVLVRKHSLPNCEPGTMVTYGVYGDCMERAGVYEGDIVLCDAGRRPKMQGDLVLFEKKGEVPCIKQYYGVYGCSQWVRTCYENPKRDRVICVEDEAFIGVVTAVLEPHGFVKQSFDVSDYPTELQRKRTLEREPGNAVFIRAI